jgi:hypothetical protein
MKRLKSGIQVNQNAFLLIKTLAMMFFAWHMGACGYWAIAMSEGSNEQTESFMPPDFIVDASDWHQQYSYAFFWCLSVTTGAS